MPYSSFKSAATYCQGPTCDEYGFSGKLRISQLKQALWPLSALNCATLSLKFVYTLCDFGECSRKPNSPEHAFESGPAATLHNWPFLAGR